MSVSGGQTVRVVEARFLAGQSLHEQLREMAAGAARGRTERPILHIHVDPPRGYDTPEVIGHWLAAFEREFGLREQQRAGVLHRGKDGADRLHAHVLYSIVLPDGRTADLRNSYRRREKVSVLVAHQLGLPMPPVPRPRAIHRQLLREGREDVASWMVEHCAGLHSPMRIAEVSPQERHVSERTGCAPEHLLAKVGQCWPSQSPVTFRRDLARHGLVLATGTNGLVIVDTTGAAYSLPRCLRKVTRAAGQSIPPAAEVRIFLDNMRLPTVHQIRKLRSSMAPKKDVKAKIMVGITGEAIVAQFHDLTRFVKKGPPHRIHLNDGGWVTVDPAASRLIVSGPIGNADSLAARLAEVEPFAIERRPMRQRSAASYVFKALRPKKGSLKDRFDWWADHEQSPEMRPDGIAVTVGGTFLVDQGNRIEVHDMPPSTESLELIAQYAAEHWGGGLVLDGPPGAIDWNETDKARLWWACRKHGVVFHGYNPPPALLARWEAENGGLPTGAAALRPETIGKVNNPDRTKLNETQPGDRIIKIDEEIDAINAQWQAHGRDMEWIERMRKRVELLEDERRVLRASLTPEAHHYQVDYQGMKM